jgi:hypothetical protein
MNPDPSHFCAGRGSIRVIEALRPVVGASKDTTLYLTGLPSTDQDHRFPVDAAGRAVLRPSATGTTRHVVASDRSASRRPRPVVSIEHEDPRFTGRIGRSVATLRRALKVMMVHG